MTVLTTYFDASNKADSTHFEVVTLCAIAGTSRQFRAFEKHWMRILKKHGAKYLHTTDAVSGNKHYEGWSFQRRHALLQDCVEVIGSHIAIKQHGVENWRNGLLPSTTTVVLKDFIAARLVRDDMADTAEELMIRQATAVAAAWADIQRTKWFHFFFDQGESYRGFVCDIKTRAKARKDAPWIDRIVQNAEVNMCYCPGVQLADIFAWCVSNRDKNKGFPWYEEVLQLDRFDQWIDKDNIGTVIADSQRIWDSWGINRRKPTK